MAMAMWAKSAVGTNLGFVRDFSKILKSWREILQSTLQKKHIPTKLKTQQADVYGERAKRKCLYQLQPTFSHPRKSLQSRLFHSVLSKLTNQTITSELRRQAALRLSSYPGRSFKNMPIMSLVGLALGVNLSSVMDDGQAQMMSELQDSFRSFTFKTEPLEKQPTCLDDLLINEKSIANGCEGAVYKAKMKSEAVSTHEAQGSAQLSAATDDGEYNLAVKAVFNYSAESNAHSILNELQREIVPLRPEGCKLDAPLSERVGRLPPHPNIVDMPGIFVDKMLVTEEGLKKFPAAMPQNLDPENFYGHNKTLYLVMRRRSGHLREFLSNKTVDIRTRCKILAQLLEGVAHLRQHGVAHRDLKADNILVDMPNNSDCPRVEICDFGCCLAEENQVMKIPYPTKDMYLGGNTRLMAPEIITAIPGPASVLDYSKSDLWAVGALAYEILGADNPFYPTESNSYHHLNSYNYKEEELPNLPGDVPEALKQLVQKLLSRDPEQRPSASVAVAVAQMTALALSSSSSPLNSSSLRPASTRQNLMEDLSLNCLGQQPLKGKLFWHKRCHDASTATATSYHQWLSRKRKWLNWILAQGLTLVCQLTFGGQSKPWNTQSILTFLFLSRLTYADFQEAMTFF